MTIVEHKFFDESENDQLKDDPVKCGQFTSEATSAPLHHDERQVHERNADYCLIDDHHHDSLLQLSTIHLQHHHHRLTGHKVLKVTFAVWNRHRVKYSKHLLWYVYTRVRKWTWLVISTLSCQNWRFFKITGSQMHCKCGNIIKRMQNKDIVTTQN